MMLYGRTWTRRELEARVARIENQAGVRKICLAEGPEAGVELFWVRTGAGLAYYVNPSRALDIGLTEYCGVPLSWQSVTGEVHPLHYDPRAFEWLRTASGGLLMTCGLTQVGAPCEDEGEELGLHGRIHHLAARHVGVTADWRGDDYELTISGLVEQTRIFGENLRLTRVIRSRLGSNRIILDDRVENAGFTPVPHMILYHLNFGFPFMSEHTLLRFPEGKVVPRDGGVPVAGFDSFEPPRAGYQERVYYHELPALPPGEEITEVRLTNPHFPLPHGEVVLTVSLRWDRRTLPRLVEWKMPAAGVYALGVEPANCYVEGRAAERARGTLVTLAPGESRDYHLECEVRVGES